MKKMKTKNKCLVTSLAIIAMLMMSLGVKAQNVTIDLDHGSLLAAMTDNGETGSEQGFKALWRHEQLALSMTGTDRDGLTETGEVLRPSAVFGERNGKIFIAGGRRPSFIVVSLPKGYRITGYTLVLANDLVGANVGSGNFGNLNSGNGFVRQEDETESTMRFYEVKPWKTDKTNAGTIEDRGSGYDGYTDNQVRYLALGTGYDYVNQNPERGGTIGTASTDILATAKNGDDIDINPSDTGKKYTISRTSTDANPMGNQIYFRLVKDYYYYGLTIESFEIRFTAEGTFTAYVKPTEASTTAVSMDKSSFKTNKIDIGEMSMNQQPGNESNTQFSYKWGNVKDLDAFNYIYQDDAYGMDDDFGGNVPKDVASSKNIYKVDNGGNYWYGLKSDVYFVEPPIEIENLAHNMVPIGYRIVGAKINYALGQKVIGSEASAETFHYITYESGGTTYYLNTSGVFGTEPVTWEVDENNYVHNGSIYLTYDNNRNLSTGNQWSNNKALLEAETTDNTDTRRLYITGGGTRYLNGATSGAPRFRGSANDYAYWTTETVNHPAVLAYDPEPYQIQLYDRTGTKIAGDDGIIDVNADNPSGSKDLGLLNNDAIKFEILRKNDQGEVVSFSQNGMALVTVDLYLQALNPYIDKMDIVCQDSRKVLSLTQTFTADNFSVAGDRFIFYVPSDYGNEWLDFTFSGLYSKYGDNTYYDGSGHGNARYSFVRSPYFITVDGYTEGNKGLYNNTAYSSDHPYQDKVYTVDAGKYRFKFNNAEDLAVERPGETAHGYLTEYPFSVKKYMEATNPGDKTAHPAIAASNDTGEFIQCKLHAQTQKTGTYYVFTADETRYNIAPTDGWQHRYYAFYRMEIELVAKTFEPDLKWTKIYDTTLYNDGTGDDKEDSMWGLTLDVKDTDNNGQKVTGYLTYQEIIDNIMGRAQQFFQDKTECNAVNAKQLTGGFATGAVLTEEQATAFNNEFNLTGEDAYAADDPLSEDHAYAHNIKISGAVKIGDEKFSKIDASLDKTNTNAPATMKQILYIDGTPLYAMLNSSQYSVYKTLEDLQAELNPNALVFLPENTTSTLDNVAYETSSTSSGTGLQAGKDIVLTDKIPFFTPYLIQVDAANKATYRREQSGSNTFKLVDHATVVLPFTLSVSDGKHTNVDNNKQPTSDGFAFNLRTLKKLRTPVNNNYYEGDGYFELFTGTETKANQPYMVEVKAGESDDYSFIATQYGATIEPTPTVYDLEENEGKPVDQVDISKGIGVKNFESIIEKNLPEAAGLTSYGTYSGSKIPINKGIYYFNKDQFYCSTILYGKYDDVNVRPFRAYYAPESYAVSATAKMTGFSILYDLFSDDGGITTSLTETSKPKVMTITTERGTMLISANEDIQVKILSTNGVNVDAFQMNAGEQRQVNVPSGIYIVNNTKILVK
jgi:hypothetical protein